MQAIVTINRFRSPLPDPARAMRSQITPRAWYESLDYKVVRLASLTKTRLPLLCFATMECKALITIWCRRRPPSHGRCANTRRADCRTS
jgi:hypothetical protein